MDPLELLKLLLQEKKYPYFDDDELDALFITYKEDVYLTASKLCLMKADGDKKVKVGPIEIEGPGSDYWINLSNDYSKFIIKDTKVSSGGYKSTMKRADGQ